MSSNRATTKPSKQPLYSKALTQGIPTPTAPSISSSTQALPASGMAVASIVTMDRILQEISAVARRLDGLETSISALAMDTKSKRADITGF